MNQFIRKVTPVTAYQFTGDRRNQSWPDTFKPKAGDYIIEGENGELSCLPEDKFLAMYTPVAEKKPTPGVWQL